MSTEPTESTENPVPSESNASAKKVEPARNIRRHHRDPYGGPVQVSWEDAFGRPQYAQTKCVDISEKGLRVEARQAIPVSTYVMLRAERLNISGASRVRHLERLGSKFILGLELNDAVREKALALIREASSR